VLLLVLDAVPESEFLRLAVAVAAGSLAAALLVRRVLPDARRYTRLHLALAAGLPLAAASLEDDLLAVLGIDPDALSHAPSLWAIGQEAIGMSLFLAVMVGVPFLVLSAQHGSRRENRPGDRTGE
jgi:hypothetical protein